MRVAIGSDHSGFDLKGAAILPGDSGLRFSSGLSPEGREGQRLGRHLARIRESMAVLTPAFSANRTVRQYTEEQHIPAATACAARPSGDAKLAAAFRAWQEQVARHWEDVHFGALNVDAQDGDLTFEVQVYLGDLDPSSVLVELYAEPQEGAPAFRQEMRLSAPPAVSSGPHSFSTRTPATRDAVDFTPRILPH